jgi:hypothetical protein
LVQTKNGEWRLVVDALVHSSQVIDRALEREAFHIRHELRPHSKESPGHHAAALGELAVRLRRVVQILINEECSNDSLKELLSRMGTWCNQLDDAVDRELRHADTESNWCETSAAAVDELREELQEIAKKVKGLGRCCALAP